ncbi:MAG: hypothetical protein IJN74_04970 [Clostridia bacterium]|nr:hypothetical protein [Clostridia bacterium]
MATIQKIIPANMPEEEVQKTYDSFVLNQRKAYRYVTEHVRAVADPILYNETENPERINDLMMQVSASTNIFKILTEKMTKLS